MADPVSMPKTVSIPVKDRTGAEVGRYEFDPSELAPEINKQLLHDVVVMYEANQRVGTMRSKGRSQVIGSGKKLFRQKGTGNARVGSGSRTRLPETPPGPGWKATCTSELACAMARSVPAVARLNSS